MDLPAKLDDSRARLRYLQAENDLLRASLSRQCHHLQEPSFWMEQGVSFFGHFLRKQNILGKILGFFGR